MKITRELVAEAIELAKGSLPQVTAVELSQVLEIPLRVILKVMKANERHFAMGDQQRPGRIDGLKAGVSRELDPQQVLSWFLDKNGLVGSDRKYVFTISKATMSGDIAARIKWENDFALAVCSYMTSDNTHGEALARMAQNHKPLPCNVSRMVRLGTVLGHGQTLERYIYGVPLTHEEALARKIGDYPIFNDGWATQDMIGEQDWVALEYEPESNQLTQRLQYQIQVDAKPSMAFMPPTTSPETLRDLEALRNRRVEVETPLVNSKPPENGAHPGWDIQHVPNLTSAPPPQAETAPDNQDEQDEATAAQAAKRPRRTQIQLEAVRTDMHAKALAMGVSPEQANRILTEPKFNDAEKLFREMKPVPAVTDVVAVSTQTPVTTAEPVTTTVPVSEIVAAPHRPAMATLDQFQETPKPTPPIVPVKTTIADIKADIRTTAGASAPEPIRPVAPGATAAAALAALPPPAMPPMAAQPPPAAAPASRPVDDISPDELLNSLLIAAGN